MHYKENLTFLEMDVTPRGLKFQPLKLIYFKLTWDI